MLRFRSGQGITLLELMIAIILVAILTVVAVPTFVNFSNKQRLEAYSEELRNVLMLARSEAIKRNQTVYVNFGTGDTWCYGLNAGGTCNCSVANNCGLKSVSYERAGQLSLSVTGMSSNTISFDAARAAASSSATATFTIYGKTTYITLKIGRLGGIEMCSNELSGYASC